MQGVRVRSPPDAGGDIHVLGRSKSRSIRGPRCFTWLPHLAIDRRLADPLDRRLPSFFIRNTTPFFEKRWLVSENQLGSWIDFPSNCRNAALVSGSLFSV